MKVRMHQILGLVLVLAALAGAQAIQTRMAPDFTLPDMDGKVVTLSKNYGQGPIYISFWATWCKPCMEELKIIEKIYEKYKGQGFQVFAINTEGPKAAAKIKSFVKANGLTFKILLDNDGEVFRRTFKGTSQPFTILTSSTGKMVLSQVGFKPGDEIEIEKLITSNILPPAADSSTKSE
jgi:cytochrome c biogenesis protein CcmG, thiol:disulfide interchange protein DsbE